jgi:hypothetical protein
LFDILYMFMGTALSPYTSYLFARPSFWAGTASLFDFGNTLFEYNISLTPEQANIFALRADWRAVGEDLRHAIKEEGVTIGAQEEA